METQKQNEHPFLTTLGVGPYTVVGFMEISLNERTGSAITGSVGLTKNPKWKGGCGTCMHCGTAIMHICVIRNGLGELFGVGTTCVMKVDLPEKEMTIVKQQVRKKLATNRRILADKKRNAVLDAIKNKSEELKAIPHPYKFRAERGGTYLEYCQSKVAHWVKATNDIYKFLKEKNIVDKVK